ncbi:MAG TPA: glutamine synthetase family protein [Terriglobales bacterium]
MNDGLAESLNAAGVRFIRVLWCDNANVIRAKAFHLGIFAEHAEQGIGIAAAQQAVPVMADVITPDSGLGPVGEVWLVPVWSTLRILPYAPTHAAVIGDMRQHGQPWALCPRHCLKRQLAAAQTANLEIMAAFENEFYLLQTTPAGIVPADETVFAATLAMDCHRPVIDAMAEALLQQGLKVERYYPESGPGQQEISVRYAPAVTAADQQIAFRETVRAVALQHGLKASFLPKVFADKAGSGCHLHLSLWRDGWNQLPETAAVGGLSQIARAFIAGLLQHLPALMALTTPSPNSYRRLRPHSWSGAFRAWGVDNREAAIRIPSNPTSPSPTHLELKTVDASANPYLALAAVIAAGLDGIRQGLDPGEPVATDPGHLTEAERAARGLDPLPTTLSEAIAHLRQDQVLLTALGPELAQAYLAVRTAEWEALKDLELADEVKLLLERY